MSGDMGHFCRHEKEEIIGQSCAFPHIRLPADCSRIPCCPSEGQALGHTEPVNDAV